jgi:hypothetical protein
VFDFVFEKEEASSKMTVKDLKDQKNLGVTLLKLQILFKLLEYSISKQPKSQHCSADGVSFV